MVPPRIPKQRPSTDSLGVTVVMPAHNRAHLITRALHSVGAQTVPPAAVIVVDDASTDATVARARALGATVIEQETNQGSGPARNRGIEAAETEWVAFLDSDDMWHPHHLERLLGHADPDVALVTAPGVTTVGDVRGHPGGTERSLGVADVLTADLVCTSGTMVRRSALLEAGGFRALRRAQDLDMWLRVLRLGRGVALPGPSVTYDLHDQQAVLDTDLMRSCVDQILVDCREQQWVDDATVDRALVRRHWDAAADARREGRSQEVRTELEWILARPKTWSTLVRNLHARRTARAEAR